SDAGTPGISDPGARIVRAARLAGVRVWTVPGPSAVAALVSIAGLRAESFRFVGFLPTRAQARAEAISAWRDATDAIVLYESPHRIRATLAAIAESLGDDREIVVGRELTKRFEESIAMRAGEALAWLDADPNRSRGEFVIAIDAAPARAAPPGEVRIETTLDALLARLLEHMPPSRASRLAQGLTGRPGRGLCDGWLARGAAPAAASDAGAPAGPAGPARAARRTPRCAFPRGSSPPPGAPAPHRPMGRHGSCTGRARDGSTACRRASRGDAPGPRGRRSRLRAIRRRPAAGSAPARRAGPRRWPCGPRTRRPAATHRRARSCPWRNRHHANLRPAARTSRRRRRRRVRSRAASRPTTRPRPGPRPQ